MFPFYRAPMCMSTAVLVSTLRFLQVKKKKYADLVGKLFFYACEYRKVFFFFDSYRIIRLTLWRSVASTQKLLRFRSCKRRRGVGENWGGQRQTASKQER